MGDETETLVVDPGTQKNLGETRGFGSGSRDAADSLNREGRTDLLLVKFQQSSKDLS